MSAGRTVTVRVPIAFRRQHGRKRVVRPDGSEMIPPAQPHIDQTLVKALARAHRWQRMIEDGEYATLQDIAAAERINPSYVSRVLRLTLLAPDIIEAILDGPQQVTATLRSLMIPFSPAWDEQRALANAKV